MTLSVTPAEVVPAPRPRHTPTANITAGQGHFLSGRHTDLTSQRSLPAKKTENGRNPATIELIGPDPGRERKKFGR